MNGLVIVVQDILAILAMLGVLLQTPKATGLGGVISGDAGGGGGYRRRRGIEATMYRLTWAVVLAFVAVCLVSTITAYHS